MVNWFLKLFDYVNCAKCKKTFRKHKNTSVGGRFRSGVWVTYYYCPQCTTNFLNKAFSGQDVSNEFGGDEDGQE